MKTSMEVYTILVLCSSLSSFLLLSSTATDSITMSRSLRDGDTIVSAGGSFELGFFSPDSTKRYVGIWYKKISIRTVVWVANREIPLVDSSGVLKVTNQGILALLNRNETIIWSSNSSRSALNPVAQLLDSGNLVLRDANNPENFLWQSFDYPGDTFLPGMKLGRSMITGLEWYLSSWKSTDNPSPGNFTFWLDPRGYPQLVIRKGLAEQFSLGPWNGVRDSGFSDFQNPNPVFKVQFVLNQKEMYYIVEPVDTSVLTRLVLSQNGLIQSFLWVDRTQAWNLFRTAPNDDCDSYAICGAYVICNIDNSPECECLKGFVPQDVADGSNSCVRKTPLNCLSEDGFMKLSGVKVPDTRYSWFNKSMTLEECKLECLKNCSCMAYTSLDINKGGSGCLLWFGDLIDIKALTQNGQEIYFKVASSELARFGSHGKKRVGIIVGSVLAGMLLLVLGLALYIWKKKKQSRLGKKEFNQERGYTTGSPKEDLELPLFDFTTVANATNDFSINNKLGEGGFGPVYKGVLEGGQEIAVKRLSKNSKQGFDEFMNEVSCIAKLQHRNLVKLLGCCIQEEKMLIYEYMPNKSLDFFIFDETRSKLLNWKKRFHIINGIARGLLYLHQDSRLRIIHRDLKVGNILLDYELNPKISDFGMARSFGGNETEANTARVVGTYGYMSPEYAIDGIFSVKSDVFSFGVLVLEIVSGKKNRGFHHPDHHHNLLGHAWRLHKEGRSLELIDPLVGDSCNLVELLRSIHVGLLCVQQSPEDRPNMSYVVMMLGSETILSQPKQPGFFTERNMLDGDTSSSKHELCSVNEITFTSLAAR